MSRETLKKQSNFMCLHALFLQARSHILMSNDDGIALLTKRLTEYHINLTELRVNWCEFTYWSLCSIDKVKYKYALSFTIQWMLLALFQDCWIICINNYNVWLSIKFYLHVIFDIINGMFRDIYNRRDL